MNRNVNSRRQGPPPGASRDGDSPAGFKNYITPRGYKRLKDEYTYLRIVDRPHLVEEVAHAASLGDRSENAEYIYGKKRLREIDRRMRWLHKRLAAAEVVEPSQDRGTAVFFGATVTVGWPDGSEKVFDLVGEDEIEADLGRISWRSPIGQALMRKKEGDAVRFQHLAEKATLDIVEVVYKPQDSDPPSRWDLHKAAFRAAGKAVVETLELPPDLDEQDPEGEPET